MYAILIIIFAFAAFANWAMSRAAGSLRLEELRNQRTAEGRDIDFDAISVRI